MKNLELDNIFIPSKIPSKKLMIILHGRGDSSEGFRALPEILAVDEMNYLLLDAPFEYYTGYSWYPLPPNQISGIEYSSTILKKVLDVLFADEFNAEESFLFGFSQGALLTFEFGARYEKVLAGYIAVSGYIYDEVKLLVDMNENVKNSNWLCTYGIEDSVLDYETSQKQIEFLQENGFDVEFQAFHKEHSIASDELEMIRKWMKKIIENI